MISDISLYISKLGSTVIFNGDSYNYEKGFNYYKIGRHAIFISNSNNLLGYKFFVIKGICYDLEKITELFNIHNLLYKDGWAIRAMDICECQYNNQVHYGLLVENGFYSNSGKDIFDKQAFREYCSSQPGLYKREFYLERTIGQDWYIKEPEKKFFVGDNNLLITHGGKTVLFDLDPRWGLKNPKLDEI